jgi:hypothetical protein
MPIEDGSEEMVLLAVCCCKLLFPVGVAAFRVLLVADGTRFREEDVAIEGHLNF